MTPNPDLFSTAPRRLTLAGKRWALKFQNPPRDDDPYQNSLGMTAFYSLTIFIRPDQPVSELLDTVLHELQHAITYSYGPFHEGSQTCDIEEQAAMMAGRGWADLLTSNPKFLPWLHLLAEASRKEHN